MCGISLYYQKNPSKDNIDFRKFNNRMAHRGPDAEMIRAFVSSDGAWPESNDLDQAQLLLGHRRLSIIDLSEAANQPLSYCGRFWIVFNGEIYNYVELRAELSELGFAFKTQSDTEVILAAYAKWGTACFARLRGMWGMAIFDRKKQELILSRDRLGIKPLYYYQKEDSLAVASELKQITALQDFPRKLNLAVAKAFLYTGFESTDQCFFQDIHPVRPGTFQTYDLITNVLSPAVSFWQPEKEPMGHITDVEEAGATFQAAFFDSVKVHMRSDVPVGCQLSGGLDSSSVLAAMHAVGGGTSDIHTFTAAFPGFAQDETSFVHAVTAHIPVNDHYVQPNPESFLADLKDFVYHQEEPVISFSMYAGYAVARLIQEQGIKVVLNGQGGDEVLGGYWQMYFAYLFGQLRQKPFYAFRQILGSITPGGNAELVAQMPSMLRRYFYKKNMSTEIPFQDAALREVEVKNYLGSYLKMSQKEKRIFDIRKLILPRLLKYDDRNLMAFGIEGRYPFLDHEFIERCLAIDPSAYYQNGWTKYPIRKGMKNYLPKEIIYRKSKWGFATPQAQWLSSEFSNYIETWFREDRPVFDMVDRTYLQHLRANMKQDHQNQLFFRFFSLDQWMAAFNVKM